MSFFILILIGALAGFISGKLMRGEGFGVVGNIIVGIIGAVLGGWIFTELGVMESNFIYELAAAIVGAVLFLLIVGFIKR